MAAMDIALRNRFVHDCFAIAGQHAGLFQPVQFLSPEVALVALRSFYFLFRFRVGKFLRLVLATLRSSFRLIDLYMLLDAPRSDDFDRLPRLAASAAPAAICCFFDLAGIARMFRRPQAKRIYSSRRRLSPEKINGYARQHEQHSDS